MKGCCIVIGKGALNASDMNTNHHQLIYNCVGTIACVCLVTVVFPSEVYCYRDCFCAQ